MLPPLEPSPQGQGGGHTTAAPKRKKITHLPAPEKVAPAKKLLPINLDTVLALADNQNGEMQLAREKLHEAFVSRDIAQKAWLPNFYLGGSYFHHEGGIQQPDGQLIRASLGSAFAGLDLQGELDLRDVVFQRINAERRIWQQRGELSRLSSETLLDAANTYIDMLSARSGEAISLEQESKIQKTLEQAKKLAAIDPGLQVEVERVNSQLFAQKRITWQFRKGIRAASAKLVHLLQLDPNARLFPVDPQLVPIRLLDAKLSDQDLVVMALRSGPGIQEMEGLLAVINRSQEQARGIGRFLPIFQTRTLLGGFGGGTGSTLNWTNRWETSIQAKWNLTNFATAKEKSLQAQSKIQQLHLNFAEMRSKLALGVREAYQESVSSFEQIELGKKQIESARSAYKLSEDRFVNRIKGGSASEVLLALQALAGARLNYLNAVRSYDKAQMRLLILTGLGKKSSPH